MLSAAAIHEKLANDWIVSRLDTCQCLLSWLDMSLWRLVGGIRRWKHRSLDIMLLTWAAFQSKLLTAGHHRSEWLVKSATEKDDSRGLSLRPILYVSNSLRPIVKP